MTPAALYSGARDAKRLCAECAKDGEHIAAWRHHTRAEWYLQRRAMLLRFEFPKKLEQAA